MSVPIEYVIPFGGEQRSAAVESRDSRPQHSHCPPYKCAVVTTEYTTDMMMMVLMGMMIMGDESDEDDDSRHSNSR